MGNIKMVMIMVIIIVVKIITVSQEPSQALFSFNSQNK